MRKLFPEGLFLFLLCFRVSVSGEAFSDKSILVEFKSLVSDPMGILSSWSSSNTNHCSWFGVACNSESRVVSLNITGDNECEGNSQSLFCSKILQFSFGRLGIRKNYFDHVGKLKGSLSPLIGKLSELRVLSLPFNELSGEIPLEMWGLENLEVLDLEGNLFSGNLPSEFVRLWKLRVLNLGFNRLNGEIPMSLSKCASLEVLNLAGNKLKGSIPKFIASFYKLRELNLAYNELNGTVAAVLGNKCQYLEHLDLSGNSLLGKIPSTLGKCRQLKTLLLFSNMLNGEIPHEIGQLRRLEVLDISKNFIGGEIPAELGNCVELSVLVISSLFETWLTERNESIKASVTQPAVAKDEYNHLWGSIPQEITTLPKLRVLWAPRATFQGRLPSNWGECKSLEMVNLAQNGFIGGINGIFKNCKKLIYLDLSSNRLTGELDNKLPVPCMAFFDVSYNLMSGSIPKFNCQRVCPRVSYNSNSGLVFKSSDGYMSFFAYRALAQKKLPFSVTHLAVIHNFSGNNFTGPIHWLPVAPGRLGKQIDYAFLANGNKLSGAFPSSIFGKCSKLHGMIINVSKNQISGPIPSNIGSICRSLRFLDASENKISGSLPQSLGDLKFLVSLNLSWNKLQGQIPVSLYRLKYLKHVSLASNNLSGAFPSSFWQSSSDRVFEFSFNAISRKDSLDIVKQEKLNSFPADNSSLIPSVSTNVRSLTSINVSSNDLPEPLNDQTNSNEEQLSNAITPSETKRSGFKAIEIASVASASAVVSVLLVLVILFFYTRKQSQRTGVQISEPKDIKVFSNIGVPILYENIVEATGNFSAGKCIGNGGFGATYKAEISPGTLVAIKKLAIGRLQGVQQFRAEIKALGRVRHPNLVTLIGYHASEMEMFLIYNYLPGGNLEDFIKERSPRAADWKVLHKIALDIATALAYLHHQSPRVLHRDIKPSNILLDDDLNAYLSDFGLSRLLGNSETHATTGVAGTFGYVAPEYAMTCRVSEKSDVYSYGVVLLELISDKKALDPSFSAHENGFNIVSWACMLLRHGQAKDVFNAGLWDSGPEDDLVDMLHLAIKCTFETLSTRPTMKQVVQQLKQIQPT